MDLVREENWYETWSGRHLPLGFLTNVYPEDKWVRGRFHIPRHYDAADVAINEAMDEAERIRRRDAEIDAKLDDVDMDMGAGPSSTVPPSGEPSYA